MTVVELIEELREFPGHWRVFSCDGMGLSGEASIEAWDDPETERIWITG